MLVLLLLLLLLLLQWLCAPRGSAMLWVHPRHRDSVRPLVVSHGWGSGFSSEFIWDGERMG